MPFLSLPSIFILPANIEQIIKSSTELASEISSGLTTSRTNEQIVEKILEQETNVQRKTLLQKIPKILQNSLNAYGFLFSNDKILIPVLKEYKLKSSKGKMFIIPISPDNSQLVSFAEYTFAIHSLIAIRSHDTMYDLLPHFYYSYFIKLIEYNSYENVVMGFRFKDIFVNKLKITKDKIIIPVTEDAIRIAENVMIANSIESMLDVLVEATLSAKNMYAAGAKDDTVDVGQFSALMASILSGIFRNETIVLGYIQEAKKGMDEKEEISKVTNIIDESAMALADLFEIDKNIFRDSYILSIEQYYSSLIKVLFDLKTASEIRRDLDMSKRVKAILSIIIQIALNKSIANPSDNNLLFVDKDV